MLPDRVSNPGPLTYESGALPIALRGPAVEQSVFQTSICLPHTCNLIFSLKTNIVMFAQTVACIVELQWLEH